MTYSSEFALTKVVTLAGGAFRESAEGTPGLVVKMQRVAWGDLDGDGDEDAAVVLLEAPDSARSFYTLHVVIDDAGTPSDVAAVQLAEVEALSRVEVEEGVIQVLLSVRAEGESDETALPAQRKVRFVLRNGELEEVGSE